MPNRDKKKIRINKKKNRTKIKIKNQKNSEKKSEQIFFKFRSRTSLTKNFFSTNI